jgi:hypothetical protein
MKQLLLITILIVAAWSGWSQNSITQGASKTYTIQMNVGESAGASYSWEVTPFGGTSTNVATVSGNSVTILWDGPVGVYSVNVQVTDGNGCLSETISQGMEILAPGNLIFAAALPSTQTCSDLTGGEGSVPGHSESSFRITYAGAANLTSAKITVKNPNGDFTALDGIVLADQGNPEITVNNDAADKAIDFAITDTWENNSGANVEFEITLLSAVLSDTSEITADTNSDVTRTAIVLPKPVIAFE